MACKKVPLRYIGDRKARGLTFKTRRDNLMKKAGEVGVLCNTKAVVLVYPEGATVPQVYPSHAEAVAILNRYKDAPDLANYKKIVTQEEFLTKRVAKLQLELNKARNEREDREVRFLLHKAMLAGTGTLTAEEVTRVAPKLEAILKILAERIAKTTGQPPVFQPQAPDVSGSVDMGPPPMYQAPPQQQEGWQPPVIQPQAPHVTGSLDMGPPPMYQAPPQQQEGWQPPAIQPQAPLVTGSLDMGPPPMYQAPAQQQEGWHTPVFQPQAPYVTGSVDMGTPPIYDAPPQQQEGWQPEAFQPQAPYVTGGVDMGPPQMYQAPQQQEAGPMSEGDHDPLAYYSGYSTGGHDGAGTISSADLADDDMMMQFLESFCSQEEE